MIHQLLYISSATRPMLRIDIESILFTARKLNLRNEITGMLIASQSRFMQILEGEENTVRETYDRICRDNRHHASVILREIEVSQRQFDEWSMTSRFITTAEHGDLADQVRNTVSACDVITSSYLLGFTQQQLAA
jgi:Sensors of blue-light using FAD